MPCARFIETNKQFIQLEVEKDGEVVGLPDKARQGISYHIHLFQALLFVSKLYFLYSKIFHILYSAIVYILQSCPGMLPIISGSRGHFTSTDIVPASRDLDLVKNSPKLKLVSTHSSVFLQIDHRLD